MARYFAPQHLLHVFRLLPQVWHDAVAMPTKRRLLDLLTRADLQAVADRYGLAVKQRRVKDQLVEGATSSRKVQLADVLADLSRDRLKELCRELGVDDGGREKALLIERLVGTASSAAGSGTTSTCAAFWSASPAPSPSGR